MTNILPPSRRVYCQPVVYQRLPRPEVESADHLLSILVRGMQILHHHPNGSVVKSVLSFDEGRKCFLVTSTERGSGGFFGINASKVPMVSESEGGGGRKASAS